MMASFLDLGRRHVWRTPRALVQFLHRQEQRADHRCRFVRAQDLREVARLDPKCGVDRQLQAFIDALHDRARRRVIVEGFTAIDRIARREHHHAGLGVDRPTRQPERLVVPGRDRLAAALDPVLGCLDEIGRRHHGIDQFQRLGLVEIDGLALEQELHRILRRHDARHALGATGAGEKSDLHLRQSETRLRVVRRHAIVAGERAVRTPPPSARPLIAATHGLPEVSIARNISDILRLSSNSIWLAATSPLVLEQRLA